MDASSNISKIQNIKLQIKSLESQFDNLEIQMNNSLMMPNKINVQIQNAGLQFLNLGIQTLNIYKQMSSIISIEESNQFNQNIENIIEQMKNLFFPNQLNPMMPNFIDNMNNMNNMGNNMMNQGMNPMMNPMMISGMNPLGMNNDNNLMNNPIMMQNNAGLNDTTGINNPIFKLMNSPMMMQNNAGLDDTTTGMQNPIFNQMMLENTGMNNPIFGKMSITESQNPLLKEIKITFKRMNGQEKTKSYLYFKTKVCDMLRDFIIEEKLKKETTFVFNGNKLSKLNQSYICDILNDNSVILVQA